jgi:hypothetical protein
MDPEVSMGLGPGGFDLHDQMDISLPSLQEKSPRPFDPATFEDGGSLEVGEAKDDVDFSAMGGKDSVVPIYCSDGDYSQFAERCKKAAQRLAEPLGINIADTPACRKATEAMYHILRCSMSLEQRHVVSFPDSTPEEAAQRFGTDYIRDTTGSPPERKKGRPKKRALEFCAVVIPSPKRHEAEESQ